MSHACFISFKKEDEDYKDKICEKLTDEQIKGKSLDRWIDSDDIDYVMQVIRDEYLCGTSVTLFLIGKHSSENEGLEYSFEDNCYYNKQNYIIRELKATLYDGKGNRRGGLLGIVLPEMYSTIYKGTYVCSHCGKTINYVYINDESVIKEFHQNYYLKAEEGCTHYSESGRFCVLVKYDEFMQDPEKYIEMAYSKTEEPICDLVHWKDIDHIYKKKW